MLTEWNFLDKNHNIFTFSLLYKKEKIIFFILKQFFKTLILAKKKKKPHLLGKGSNMLVNGYIVFLLIYFWKLNKYLDEA